MYNMEYVPLSSIAEVNPSVSTNHLFDNLPVSFIPMSDVTEAGQWICHQERQFKDLSGQGYTLFQEGDILFAKITPCMENGKGAHAIGLINSIGFGTTEFHVLRVKFGNKARFLYHWLQSDSLRLKAEALMTGSAGQRRVTPKFFDIYYIPSLSPSEQQHIAHILDTLDTQIQQTEKLIAKLKQVKVGLLHDLLTQGIDENGDIRDPVAHPEEFKEVSFLQKRIKIPKKWEIQPLHSLLTGIDAGKSPNCPDQPAGAGDWGVLKVSAVHPSGFRAEENKVIINTAYINTAYEVQDGDLLISRANTYELVGIVCLVKSPRTHLLLCDKTLRLHINIKNALSKFIFYILQMSFVRSQIGMHATGSSGSMKNISQNSIKNLSVYVPPLEEQQKIITILNALDARIATEESDLAKLKQIKKGLMHDLLTGRVRVTHLIAEREHLSI